MERCWFGFLLTGVLLQGLLGHAGETTQAKIERSRQSHNPYDDRTHSGGDSDVFFDHRHAVGSWHCASASTRKTRQPGLAIQTVPHPSIIRISNSQRRTLVVIKKFSFTCSRPLRPS